MRPLADNLDRVISERERVVARITALIRAGALNRPKAPYRHAA